MDPETGEGAIPRSSSWCLDLGLVLGSISSRFSSRVLYVWTTSHAGRPAARAPICVEPSVRVLLWVSFITPHRLRVRFLPPISKLIQCVVGRGAEPSQGRSFSQHPSTICYKGLTPSTRITFISCSRVPALWA